MVLLIVLAAAANVSLSAKADSHPIDEDEMRYPIDVVALKTQFRATNTLILPAPVLGTAVIVGEEIPATDGTRLQEGDPLFVDGILEGQPGSTARMFIGEQGVYGSLTVPEPGMDAPLKIDFDVEEHPAFGFQQWVHVTQHPEVYPDPPAGNNTSLAPAPAPTSSASNATLSAATFYEFREDDGTQEAWYDFDYRDDVAVKRLDLPSAAISSNALAQMHILARASHCTDTAGTPHQLVINNGAQRIDYNACSLWSPTSFDWTSFDVKIDALNFGAINSFAVRDVASSWNDQDHHFALDTDSNFGRTDASANNVNQAGELMWFLTIDTGYSSGCVTPSQTERAKKDSSGTATTGVYGTAPDPCDPNPDCSNGYAFSWVTYHAEKSYVDEHPNDWRDKVRSAANGYMSMWREMCINLGVWPVEVANNILTTRRCSNTDTSTGPTVNGQYGNWLATTWANDGVFYDDDAFQLWTGQDLLMPQAGPPDTAFCFGVANQAEVDVARGSAPSLARSVVEGVDFSYCCDTYDPDETHERGIVSGHELAHSYGEENHPYKCNKNPWYDTASDCNTMRNCKDPDKRSFYFTSESKQEMMLRFHYAQEVNSGNEGKPDCPKMDRRLPDPTSGVPGRETDLGHRTDR